MKYKWIKYSYFIFMGVILSMFLSQYVKAAGANISFSTKETSILKGDKITVSITVTSEQLIGDFETFISYDSTVLEFIEGASFIAGGEGLLKLTDTNVMEGEKQRKYILEFNAIKVGKSEIAIYEKPMIYDFDGNNNMSVSSNRLTVEVLAKKEASTNASLSSLKISPGIDGFTFNKDITTYQLEVENKVTQVIISAIPEDEKATVSVDGDIQLKEGKNLISLLVKAEAGNVKTYNLEIERFKKEGTDDLKEEIIDNTEYIEIDSFKVRTLENDLFIESGHRYKILTNVLGEIPEGYVESSLVIDGETILGFIKENDTLQEFILLYLENQNGEPYFYQYDRVENTLQRYNKTDMITEAEKVVMEDEVKITEEYKSKILTLGFITAILSGIILLLIALLIRNYVFWKRK